MNDKKHLIIFTDCGDTIIDEGTEVRKVDGGVVYSADAIPGAKETYLKLYEEGYEIVLVADGLKESFDRMLAQHEMSHIFKQEAISEIVGAEKPEEIMFRTAMNKMGLTDGDKERIIMVGNNLERDIVGANRFGIRSVLLTWAPRRRMTPETAEEQPTYTIKNPEELLPLVEKLECEWKEKKHDKD